MAESTLSLALADIQAKLGTYAGWGRGALFGETAWSAFQQALLDDATQSGLRRFYFPEPQEGSRESYCWSFLRPQATLSLAAGANTVQLPDDFGGFEGSVSLMSTAGMMWGPVELFNPGQIDQKAAVFPTTTGRPRMAAVAWLKGTAGNAGQRAQLQVWPIADTNYLLRFQYYLLADYLNGSAPYALGGMAHAETVLESCLAVLEERLDDAQTVHREAFKARLAASVSVDRRSKAQTLGYNADRSDGQPWRRGDNHVQNGIAYNGTVY